MKTRPRRLRVRCYYFIVVSASLCFCNAFIFIQRPTRNRLETFLHLTRFGIANSNSTLPAGNDLPYQRSGYTSMLPQKLDSRRFAYPNPAGRSASSAMESERGPFPMMPSSTFLDLANSQFELLSNSIQYRYPESNGDHVQLHDNKSKIKSIALYLPQENPKTGQLEFMPSLVFPSLPKSERLFIASDAQSGIVPTIPPPLTQLPGFSHAAMLLPAYPFTSAEGGSGTVGTPEEVFCERSSGQGSSSALSLPLFSGPQTIGILLVWGDNTQERIQGPMDSMDSMWTQEDSNQISRVGETLALALCMDSERFKNRIHTEKIRVAMADNLHQVKNPVQALRTFSKLLQRNLATKGSSGNVELSRLVDDMVTQSERVVDLLLPFDSILNSMDNDDIENDDDGLNSYQRLLAPMERTDLVLHRAKENKTSNDKSMQTQRYLGSLSEAEEKKGSKSLVLSRNISFGGNVEKKVVKLEMSFLPDVLRPILSPSKAMATDLGINMEVIGDGDDAELPGVNVSPKCVQEAVVNIVDNALSYVTLGENGMPRVKNKKPKIRITFDPNDDDLPPGVTILVEDNGPGIPWEERDAIFDRGYRGENTNALTTGMGIGLDISQVMITSMGGTLELVQNKPEHLQGTVMRLILYRKPKI